MFARFRRRRFRSVREIAPDEIFLDSTNLPGYDPLQFEARVVKPISSRSIFTVGVIFVCVATVFGYRAFSLQVAHGDTYAEISKENTLDHSILFATRGLIFDRNGKELAWNEAQISSTTSATSSTYALRKYIPEAGFSLLVGFLLYPNADAKGEWWREEYSGVSGLELAYDKALQGQNGSTIVETDALGHVQRSNIVVPPVDGKNLSLSIDADVQNKFYEVLSQHA